MNRHFFYRMLLACWVVLSISALSPAQDPATGLPPLGSFSGGPDVVNLANLNVHLSIPIFSKAGKGIPFSYNLSYDSLVWTPVYSGPVGAWTPISNNWGWRATTEAVIGWVEYGSETDVESCYQGGIPGFETYTYSGFVYHDPNGGIHPFAGSVTQGIHLLAGCPSGYITPLTNAIAADNSGYILTTNAATATVNARGGVTIQAPVVNSTGNGSVTDANGNTIQVGYNSSTHVATFTDTLNTTALTISGNPPSPSSCSPAVTYTYTAPGGPAAVTVSYQYYVVQTNFQVPNIQEFPATGVCLINRVTLPDQTNYQFSYESTAGLSNRTTGRITSVQLPTGGTISYSYAGTGCYNNGNCMMADGSPPSMTRTLGGGTWAYARTPNPNLPQAWTAITDPGSNITDIYFSGIYQTAKSVYRGPRTTNLDYSYTCYNGNSSGCATAIVSAPVSSQTVDDFPSDLTLYGYTSYTYDQYGNVTTTKVYDYGTTSNALLSQTNSTYNSSLCSGKNICDHPSSVQILDGASSQKSLTSYTYDNGSNTNGNVTSISRWVSGSSNLTWQYSYNIGSGQGGTLATATDPNSTITSYSYAGTSCNSAFPTSVTVGGLTTYYAYNCNGGVVTSVTDPNNAITSTSYTDPYFWRPASVTDQLLNVTSYSYPAVGQVESVMTFSNGNGGNSTTDVLTTADNLGRPYLQQTREAPGSSNWDSVEYLYDASGRLEWLLRPFVSSAGQGSGGGSATGYTYDPLGRYTNVTDWTGVQTNYTYNLNDTTVTVSPAPSGENSKTRQYEYDIMGRLRSVCEVTTASNGYACSQNTAARGFYTWYWYDPLGHLISMAENAQSRTFTYDGLSRMTSESHPESGTTSYTYDSDSTCGASSGDKVKRYDAAGNTTCYAWDSLHRLTEVSYPSGPNTTNMPSKYYVYDSAPFWGITVNSGKGRLTEAYTYLGGNTYSADAFSYNARGDATDFYEATPHGSWYHVQQGYFANGVMQTLQGFTGTGTSPSFSDLFTYNLDGKGRPYGMVDTTLSIGIWNSTTYNVADQPTAVVQAAGGGETFQYDGNSGRMTQWQSTAGSNTQTGNLTWNANGTLQTMAITDTANAGNAQTCNYGYDDLERLLSAACGTPWSQMFSYDYFGNIWKSGSSTWAPASYTNNWASNIVYDVTGNALNDGANTYTYNAEGRQITVNGNATTFDAFNRAIEVQSGSAYTQVVYSPSGQKFAFMNNTTLIEYIDPMVAGMAAVHTSTTGYFQHADWLGSSRFAATGSGTVAYDRAYAPFGEIYAETATTNRNFTGQTQDTVSGLYDFLMRQQSAAQGRWLVPDPAGLAAVDLTNPQTWNRYAYVGNNPLNAIDPFGLYLCGTHESDPWCNGGGQGAGGGGGGYYGGAPQYTLDGLPISGPLSGFGFGTNDIAGILPPGCAGGACIVNGILVTPKPNGQFGGCSEGSGYYFYCIEFAPTPLGQGSLGTVTSVPGAGGGGARFGLPRQVSGYYPIPALAGLTGPSVTTTFFPDGSKCVGGAWNVSSPGAKAVSGGFLTTGDLGNAKNVVSSWGWTFGIQLTPSIGYTLQVNSSGAVGGPSASFEPGVIAGYGYTWCN